MIHCAYESQQSYLFDYLIKKRNSNFVYHHLCLLAIDTFDYNRISLIKLIFFYLLQLKARDEYNSKLLPGR